MLQVTADIHDISMKHVLTEVLKEIASARCTRMHYSKYKVINIVRNARVKYTIYVQIFKGRNFCCFRG